MYGETFYGRHTAQHQLQWSQIKTAHPWVKFDIMKDHFYYVSGKHYMYDCQEFCWYRSETFLEILTDLFRPLW